MTSTGNDIVALKAINIARTIQPQFYSKIITSAEEEYFDLYHRGALPFETFVWLSWSFKESVYKYIKRSYPSLVFSPSKINVIQLKAWMMDNAPEELEGKGLEDIPFCRGWVHAAGLRSFYFMSILTESFIFTVVNYANNFTTTYWGIKKIASKQPEDQSREVRVFLKKRLDILFPDNDFRIEKSEYGYPIITNGEKELAIPVSLAHHDHYVGYSFKLEDKIVS